MNLAGQEIPPQPAESLPETETQQNPLPPPPLTVLAVDDNEAKLYTITRTLQRAGYAVREAATGEEALRLAKTRPDLIILDIKLPDIDGFEVCRRLKADRETEGIPILHLSAHLTSSRDRAQGLESGADGYLTLPVEPEELIATVRSLMRLRAAEERARSAARHWQATFDAINDGVCLIDVGGTVLRCNPALAEMLRLPVERIVGQSFADAALHLLRRSEEITPLLQTAQRTAREFAVDNRWLRLVVDPLRDGGSDSGVVCILTDITERKHREAVRYAAYEREHRIAQTLQQALLNRPPSDNFPGLEMEPLYLPAWSEAAVGGDLFDAFSLKNNRAAFVIADASGKGLDAAARTAEVKFALRAFLWEHDDPAAALTCLNEYLCAAAESSSRLSSNEIGMPFVVLTLVVIDASTGEAVFASAGAEPALLLRRDGGESEALPSSGMPLGIDAEQEYEAARRDLAAGDAVLLVTDGITEARHGYEFFGFERMEETARQALAAQPLDQAAFTILEAAQNFAHGALQDDACLLLVRRR